MQVVNWVETAIYELDQQVSSSNFACSVRSVHCANVPSCSDDDGRSDEAGLKDLIPCRLVGFTLRVSENLAKN